MCCILTGTKCWLACYTFALFLLLFVLFQLSITFLLENVLWLIKVQSGESSDVCKRVSSNLKEYASIKQRNGVTFPSLLLHIFKRLH